MIYNKNEEEIVAAQGQGHSKKVQEEMRKETKKEKNKIWVEVRKGTWKLVDKDASVSDARYTYQEHRKKWYHREGLRRIYD